MQFIIERRNYIILILIFILSFWIICLKNDRIFLKSYNFKDKTITIVIYDRVNVKNVSNEIKKIYKKYEKIKDLSTLNINGELLDKADKMNVICSLSTNEITKYLIKTKIYKYIINADGNIITGKRYGNDKYNISINDVNSDKVLKIVSLENESMVTINNEKYDSLVVIGSDIINTNLVGEAIKSLSVEDGKAIALKYNCEVLWYFNNKISLSKNFSKYIV